MVLAVLSAVTIVLFVAVTALTNLYHAQQESLGNQWSTRGAEDLKNGHFELAVADFRTALRYSRDKYDYQLNLAGALIGLKRTPEANAYLVNLWEQEPENGLVNLELARIAAQEGETEHALRYYHNAVYATWPGDQHAARRDTRLELITLLLRIDARTQAQSELIALAANSAGDPSQAAHIGDLFLTVQDYAHALAEYQLSLTSNRDNTAATAGAGLAAFQLGRYQLALPYLRAAVEANPGDTRSAANLRTAELVLRMDPFQARLPVAQRDHVVLEAFATAGARVKSCASAMDAQPSTSSASAVKSLDDRWSDMAPRITQQGLRRNPDSVPEAMRLVFDIEREANAACGPREGADTALLLIAKLHEGA